jgi:hypothetical protein
MVRPTTPWVALPFFTSGLSATSPKIYPTSPKAIALQRSLISQVAPAATAPNQ